MDEGAFVLANRLVGNADGAAGLECTLLGPRVEFTDERRVAVTGADMAAALNGAEAPRGQAFQVTADDVLKLGPAPSDVRTHLGLRRPARRAPRTRGATPPPMHPSRGMAYGILTEQLI